MKIIENNNENEIIMKILSMCNNINVKIVKVLMKNSNVWILIMVMKSQ